MARIIFLSKCISKYLNVISGALVMYSCKMIRHFAECDERLRREKNMNSSEREREKERDSEWGGEEKVLPLLDLYYTL